MNDTYKLQLRHGAETRNFSTRDEVIGYINGQLQYGGVSLLPYEPILFFYGADNAKNAIIMVGLPEGKTQEGKSYFLVDTADLKEQIESLDAQYEEILQALKDEDKKIWDAVKQERQERIAADEAEAIARGEKDAELEKAIADETEARVKKDEELQEAIDFTKADLMSVIEACGLVYNERLAEGRVSYTPDIHDEVIRDAKNITEAIDKISKFAAKLGQDIKLSVANTDTVNLTIEENGKDGGNTLTAEVNIAGTEGLSKKNYDNNIIGKTSEGLYASVSVEPSVSNPNILIFRTSGYIDGQFKVDAFETEVPLAVYKGDTGKNTGITVTVDTDKNIISGELNLASDETNILKLEDGEYIVEGTAKNIKYKNTNVLNALNSQSARLDEIEDSIALVKAVEINGSETDTVNTIVEKSIKGDFTVSSNVRLSNDKSIIISDGGLKANISATFKKGTSTLLIEVGNNEYAVDLSDLAVSVLKKAEYDTETEELVLEFIVGDTTKTVRIPVGSLIHDIEVDDTNTIDMTLRSVSGGPNHISAELRVDNVHSDNILTVSSNGAYVSKAFITEAVDVESNERKAADEEIKTTLANVSELANSNKEAIATEASTARAAESANATAISTETTRATTAEGELKTDVDKNKADIANAKAVADKAASDLVKEVERATAAESVNAQAVITEKERAMAAESVLDGKVANVQTIANGANATATKAASDLVKEIERATAAEQANATAISKEINDARTAENNLKVNLEGAITTEKERAEHVESDLLEKINKNAADIQTISTEVGDIELRKEGDLSYALYVNGTKHGEFTIPKDQFLKSVTYDPTTRELIFVFNTISGETTTRVSIADLVDVYTAGDGLVLNGNAFSVDFSKVANASNVYTKDEITTKFTEYAKKVDVEKGLNAKANINSVYTKSEIDEKVSVFAKTNDVQVELNKKLDSSLASETYATKTSLEEIKDSSATKEYVDIELNKKANSSDVYTKAEIGTQLSEYAKTVDVNNKLSEKANTVYVDSNFATKDAFNDFKSVAATKLEFGTKADKTYVDDNFAKKSELETVKDNAATKLELSNGLISKANVVDVYTREEILEKLNDYAKASDVQTKLNEKLNITDAQNVYATKDALQSVKDTYATIDYVNTNDTNLDSRITNNKTAIDNFNLSYNEATSELTYTDKNGNQTVYKLYSGSLIKKGEFNPENNSIVLTIENIGVESQITIPVSELLSDLSGKITENSNAIAAINEALAKLSKDWSVTTSSTVELVKNTVGDKDTLTANVRVSSSNKQAIQSTADGLYVSNDLEDFTCVFGSTGTISGQTAISILLEDRNTMRGEIDLMKEQIKEYKDEIKLLNETVNGLLGEIVSINNATGYKTYNNPKNMSERIDKIEKNYGVEIVKEVNEIKNELGDKENPEEGTIWYEINNIVDAGTLN